MNNRHVNNAPVCQSERTRGDNVRCNINRSGSAVRAIYGGCELRTDNEACLP